jgi:hypothetical protein
MDRELEIAGAAAVGGWLRWRKKHAVPLGTPCANCETPIQGPYCHNCGQLAESFHRSIGHLLTEGFESFFHVDGRLLQTVPNLVRRPGQLTRDYLDGKRAYQIPPFRLFLVVLLIVFFVGGLNLGGDNKVHVKLAKPPVTPHGIASVNVNGVPVGADQDDVADVLNDANKAIAAAPGSKDADDVAEVRSALQALQASGAVKDPAQRTRIDAALARLSTVKARPEKPQNLTGLNKWLNDHGKMAIKNPQLYWITVEGWAHRLAFLMLPIAAFWLSLLFVFQRRFFIFDHLIFSMHSLAFQGLLLSAIFLLGALSPWFWWLILLAPVHLFIHMRKTYGSSIIGTLFRMWVLFWGSAIGFGVLMMGVLVLGLTAMDH